MVGAPVFYLQEFSLQQERIVRSKLRELSDIEKGTDFGKDFIYFGNIFADKERKHTMQDLQDLFESCDPYSPSFDSNNPGPYRLQNYPRHFIAVDDKIFQPGPKVWMASSLDFHLEDADDQLGWTIGEMDAKDAHLAWVNLDIANMGLCEQVEESQKLWLSDLKQAQRKWEESEGDDYLLA